MGAAPGQISKSPQGIDLYSRFALAGALGCSLTHGAFTPVDVYVETFPHRGNNVVYAPILKANTLDLSVPTTVSRRESN